MLKRFFDWLKSLFFPSSKPDPMTLARRDLNGAPEVGEPYDMSTYTPVYGRPVAGQTTGVVIFAGQSQFTNFINGTYSMTQSNAHMLNPYNGGVYDVKEPVVGTNGGLPGSLGNPYGSMSATVADLLRAAGWRQRVIIGNCCAGGTSSAQWATGDCVQRIRVMCRRMRANNLTPDVIFWHQGETDETSGFTSSQVRDNIRAVKAIFVEEGVTCPMLVCLVARSSAGAVGGANYLAVRQGQADACSVALGIYQGPDTDIYDNTYRWDGLHFNNTAGRSAVATDAKNAIMALVP